MRTAMDAHLMIFAEGDYVRRIAGTENLDLVPRGGVRRVQYIRERDGKMRLLGPDSEPLLSRYYYPTEFRVVSCHSRLRRQHAAQPEKETTMLHLAILVPKSYVYENIANALGDVSFRPSMIAATSPNTLKEKIRARIRENPEERWLVLSGNTIAERSEPPVTFRQW